MYIYATKTKRKKRKQKKRRREKRISVGQLGFQGKGAKTSRNKVQSDSNWFWSRGKPKRGMNSCNFHQILHIFLEIKGLKGQIMIQP